MMLAETLQVVLRVSLALGVAVLAVLVLRRPVARWFGPVAAYALWSLAPLAALGACLPARVTAGAAGPAWLSADRIEPVAPALLGLWAGGAILWLAVALIDQARFLRRAARGQAGPAVAGVLAPRVVFPADFQARFTEAERRLIRLHERTHIASQDTRVNALAMLLQAANWFNPIVHLAPSRLRLDQEMACDARVVAAVPGQRRVYGEALLKAQQGGAVSPLACAWTAAPHPLERRVLSLARGPASRSARSAGLVVVAAGAAASVTLAWTLQPARAPAPPPAAPLTILVDIVH